MHRHIVIVSDADRAAANQAAVEMFGGEAQRQTFSVPLSPTGLPPATHWGCFTSATEGHRQAMLVRLRANRVASARFWRLESGTGLLAESNHAGRADKTGGACDWPDALADMALKVITPPSPLLPGV